MIRTKCEQYLTAALISLSRSKCSINDNSWSINERTGRGLIDRIVGHREFEIDDGIFILFVALDGINALGDFLEQGLLAIDDQLSKVREIRSEIE